MRYFIVVGLAAAISSGCWSMQEIVFGNDTGADTDTDTDSDSDVDTDADSDTGTDSVPDDCIEGALLIYIVSHDRHLYSFDPPTKQLTLIGPVDCAGDALVFSMAVTREGVAYILYYYPQPAQCAGLWAVDVFTGECLEQTDFDCENPEGFALNGMGYATDEESSQDETLYITRGWGGADPWLASLDTESWDVDPIAPLDNSGELAGNGAGELWCFFAWWQEPMTLGRLDKQTGEVINEIDLDQLTGTGGTAVAYWGGDFYVFWSPGQSSGTIYRVSAETMVAYKNIDFQAVGAGSSTCAPTEQWEAN
jgi:hypothetical protein